MKRLFLIRHAKTEDLSAEGDMNRGLTEKGLKQASELGESLAARAETDFDLVLCSTAKRTRQTLDEVCAAGAFGGARIEYSEALYCASLTTLLYIVASLPKDCKSVALVFHNPSCEQLIYKFSKGGFAPVKPASCNGFEFAVDDWQDLRRDVGEAIFDFRSF